MTELNYFRTQLVWDKGLYYLQTELLPWKLGNNSFLCNAEEPRLHPTIATQPFPFPEPGPLGLCLQRRLVITELAPR